LFLLLGVPAVEMVTVYLASAALLAARLVAANTAPSAPFVNHCSSWGVSAGEADVCLRGLDLDGDQVEATVTGLPAGGLLSHRSQVYETHNYSPKAAAAIKVSDALTTRQNCLLWANPSAPTSASAGCGPLAAGGHCRVTYTVKDQNGKAGGAAGVVTLLDTANPWLGTDFSSGADGWTVVGNTAGAPAATSAPLWEASSRGLLSYYVHAKDAVIAGQAQGQQPQREGSSPPCDATTGCSDTQQWYFVAPPRFLGFQGMHYGGEISFSLMSSAGDFAQSNLNDGGRQDLVVLECATCATNTGIRLVVRMANGVAGNADAYRTFDGKPKAFRVPLTESAWLKDPKSTLELWQPPTQCEMFEVLSNLSAVRVLGDHTKWHESVSLDDFRLVAAPCTQQVPLSCDATRFKRDGTTETATDQSCLSSARRADGTSCAQHVVMRITGH